VHSVKASLITTLSTVQTVNMTIDIWSDRKMRSFLGVTAHYLAHGDIKHGQSLSLESSLLSCSRMSGSHTEERIAGESLL
jgi:hypothetical protein